MAIRIEERFAVQAPVEAVWAYLVDPRRVVTCLPGAELTEVQDERTFQGNVKWRSAPAARGSKPWKRSSGFSQTSRVRASTSAVTGLPFSLSEIFIATSRMGWALMCGRRGSRHGPAVTAVGDAARRGVSGSGLSGPRPPAMPARVDTTSIGQGHRRPPARELTATSSASRLPVALARRIDRLARRAHRFHRFAHHPLCAAYDRETLHVGRRGRVCRGCAAAAMGGALGVALGVALPVPPAAALATGLLLLAAVAFAVVGLPRWAHD